MNNIGIFFKCFDGERKIETAFESQSTIIIYLRKKYSQAVVYNIFCMFPIFIFNNVIKFKIKFFFK